MRAPAPAMLMGTSCTLAVQYICSMPWVARFIGAGSLAHPVKRMYTSARFVSLLRHVRYRANSGSG